VKKEQELLMVLAENKEVASDLTKNFAAIAMIDN